jgi:ubiquitin C-terminal hydrolase
MLCIMRTRKQRRPVKGGGDTASQRQRRKQRGRDTAANNARRAAAAQRVAVPATPADAQRVAVPATPADAQRVAAADAAATPATPADAQLAAATPPVADAAERAAAERAAADAAAADAAAAERAAADAATAAAAAEKAAADAAKRAAATPAPPVSTPAVKADYRGIVNGNNKCYMIAAIQFLYSIPGLKQLLKTIKLDKIYDLGECKDKYGVDKITGTQVLLTITVPEKKSIILALKNVFDEIENSKPGTKIDLQKTGSLKTIYDTFRSIDKDERIFPNNEQADAYEMVIKLLGVLDCFDDIDINSFRESSYIYEKKLIVCDDPLKATIPPKETVVKVRPVLEMNGTNLTIQGLVDAQLNTVKKDRIEELEACGNQERIVKDKVVNPKNREPGEIQTSYSIDATSTLILTLKRFKANYETDVPTKIKTSVEPEPTIKLKGETFTLKGCIRHIGSYGGGHYIYEGFNEKGEPLFVVNNSDVRKITAEDTKDILTQGYLYLYVRDLPADTADTPATPADTAVPPAVTPPADTPAVTTLNPTILNENSKFVIATYWTDESKKGWIQRIQEQCKAANCNYLTVKGTFEKPEFIKQVLNHTKRAVVYIDGDMQVSQYPSIFDMEGVDFMGRGQNVYSNPYIFESPGGIYYFANTAPAKDLLDTWILSNTANKGNADNVVLTTAFNTFKYRCYLNFIQLPKEFEWSPSQDDKSAEPAAPAAAQTDGLVFYEGLYFENPEPSFKPYLDSLTQITVYRTADKYGNHAAIANKNIEESKTASIKDSIPDILSRLSNKENVTIGEIEELKPSIEFIAYNTADSDFRPIFDTKRGMFFSHNSKMLWHVLAMCENLEDLTKIFNESYTFLERISCYWLK